MLQAKPGRSGKHEQEHNSPNLGPAFQLSLVQYNEQNEETEALNDLAEATMSTTTHQLIKSHVSYFDAVPHCLMLLQANSISN